MRISIITARLIAGAMTMLCASPTRAADKVVFSDQAAATAIVSVVGSAKGYFKDEGIDLDVKWALRGAQTIEAVGSGQADFGAAAPAPIIAARTNGLPITIVGLLSHGFIGYFVGAKKHSALHSLEAFKGKTIGVQAGSGMHNALLMAIQKLGLSDKDFQIQNIRVNDMPVAMQAGKFDAVFAWEPYISPIVTMGNGQVNLPPAYFESVLRGTYPLALIASETVLKTRSDVVQRFVNAFARSQHYVVAHPDESLTLLRTELKDRLGRFDPELLKKMTFVYQYDRTALLDADRSDIADVQDFLFARRAIKNKVPLDALIQNQYAKKAESQAK
jgi:ABC-type nitrate/sulfonate/bicarbonate transport system substrate-binding protein